MPIRPQFVRRQQCLRYRAPDIAHGALESPSISIQQCGALNDRHVIRGMVQSTREGA